MRRRAASNRSLGMLVRLHSQGKAASSALDRYKRKFWRKYCNSEPDSATSGRRRRRGKGRNGRGKKGKERVWLQGVIRSSANDQGRVEFGQLHVRISIRDARKFRFENNGAIVRTADQQFSPTLCHFIVRSLFNYVWFVCFHLYYFHLCISLYTCANVICIKLLLTYLLTYR